MHLKQYSNSLFFILCLRIFQIAVQQITSKKTLSSNDFREDKFEFLPVNATTSKAIGNDSYMTAETVNPMNFTIGDGMYYGYYNAPLEPKTTYRAHVRAITVRKGSKVSLKKNLKPQHTRTLTISRSFSEPESFYIKIRK